MVAITNNFLPISINSLINYILTDSDDPVFKELADLPSIEPQENQKTFSKHLKRKAIDCLNQPIAKKALLSSSSPKNSITISSNFKKELIHAINQIYEKANALSFEKIQTHYANQLNVDLQEIKKIYLAISTHCPTASEPSVIETKTSLSTTHSITIDPNLKKKIVNAINRTFDKIQTLNFDKIQTYYANQLNIDLQEMKKIYPVASPRCSVIVQPRKLKNLDFALDNSPTGKN